MQASRGLSHSLDERVQAEGREVPKGYWWSRERLMEAYRHPAFVFYAAQVSPLLSIVLPTLRQLSPSQSSYFAVTVMEG